MRFLKSAGVLGVIILFFTLHGCTDEKDVLLTPTVSPCLSQTVFVPFEDGFYVFLALLDENVYYYDFRNNDDHIYRVYRHDLSTAQTVEIGSFENFVVSADSVALVKDQLYFYVGIQQGQSLVNALYAIDLKNDSLQLCAVEDASAPFISICPWKDGLLSLFEKSNSAGETVSQIKFYDPVTQEREVILETSFSKSEGTFILAACTADNFLYTVELHRENNTDSYFVVVYDSNFAIQKEFSLAGIEAVTRSRTTEIKVLEENYIYLLTFNRDMVIGKISNAKIIPQIESNGVVPARDRRNPGSDVFYGGMENQIVSIDSPGQRINTFSMDLPEDSCLGLVLADGEDLLVWIQNPRQQNNSWYLLKKDDVKYFCRN